MLTKLDERGCFCRETSPPYAVTYTYAPAPRMSDPHHRVARSACIAKTGVRSPSKECFHSRSVAKSTWCSPDEHRNLSGSN